MHCCIVEELECTALYYNRGRCYYHNVGRPMKLSRSSFFSRPSLLVTFLFPISGQPQLHNKYSGKYSPLPSCISTHKYQSSHHSILHSTAKPLLGVDILAQPPSLPRAGRGWSLCGGEAAPAVKNLALCGFCFGQSHCHLWLDRGNPRREGGINIMNGCTVL